ncbi:hypothetical protein J3R83DRAFT_947 [Lanmaoa asiatica]|nr:hypothetical protein J3R83DRAFT_947 [Lanmaoa asiatica]
MVFLNELACHHPSLFRDERYTRNELGVRMAILICGSSVSNAFGSLIASAILSAMDGALGIPAWR